MKRLVFVLVICLALMLCACGESSSVVTIDDEVSNEPSDTVLIFSTRDDKEYLEFLTDNDAKIHIIDITTGMSTYGKGESYVVTYMTNPDDNASAVSYKYYLFKTRKQSEYTEFYSSLDFEKYEIVDISTRLSTYGKGESYVITYREPD